MNNQTLLKLAVCGAVTLELFLASCQSCPGGGGGRGRVALELERGTDIKGLKDGGAGNGGELERRLTARICRLGERVRKEGGISLLTA